MLFDLVDDGIITPETASEKNGVAVSEFRGLMIPRNIIYDKPASGRTANIPCRFYSRYCGTKNGIYSIRIYIF